MKSYLSIPLVLVTALLLVGCAKEDSSDVNQSTIYASYSASYDDTHQTLSAMATFYFGAPGGTYLELGDKSSILFDGLPLDLTTDIINQAYYENQWSGLSPNPVGQAQTFTYMDTDGTVYENSIVIPFLPVVQYSAATVTAAGGLRVAWTTPDVLGNDALALELTAATTNGGSYELPMSASGDSNSGVYTVTATDLQGVASELGVGAFTV
jgi:hypothetical protein